MTDRPVVRLSLDGKSITLSRGSWGPQVISVEQLPRQLRLYRELAARKNPRTHDERAYAHHYDPMVTALERAARAVDAMKGIRK